MTDDKKKKFVLIGFVIMFACLALYTSIVVAEFYVSKYGEVANAKIINISDLCKHKNKYLTISIDSKEERIQVYGLNCRRDEFILGSNIQVRRSRLLHIITLPNNLEETRLIVFPIFTLLVLLGLVLTIRNTKSENSTKL
jgi:hypothetical protein